MFQQTPSESNMVPQTQLKKESEPILSKRVDLVESTPAFTFEEVLAASLEYFKGDTLAANTFVTKYALRNPDGEYLERTPADMHRRLAREFARIEAKYPNPMSETEIYGYFDHFRYIVPQGSPMSGIGNPFKLQSTSNCFVAGTKVLTSTGIKPIEEVQVGDRVVTHQGRVQNVLQVHKNPLDDRQLFEIKAFRTPKITVTGNHKFWSITEEQVAWGEGPQWNSVESLRKGDWIALPNNKADLEKSSVLDLANLLEDLVFQPDSLTYTFKLSEQDVTMTSHWTRVSSKGNAYESEKDTRPINRVWTIDQDFAYFLGLWYGDGCVFNQDKQSPRVRGITFTFGSHERDLVGFVAEYGEQLFGIPPDINEHNVDLDHTIQVVFHSGLVGRVFEHLFGRSYTQKKFHESMYSWDRTRFLRCLTGLVASDGTVTASGDVRVVLGNDGLIDSFYHMARSFGMPLGRSFGTAKYNGETRTYARLDFPKHASILDHVHKTYEDDRLEKARQKPESTQKLREFEGALFVRLDRKIKVAETPEFVYTFGVGEDHSYSVEGLISQNCFVVASPSDSYGGLMLVDQQQAQIMKRRGGVGFDISTIRPRGMLTNNAAQTTDGLGIFMERFSNTCKEVAQGGRRGALMLSCDVHHPEIRTFIKIKSELTACRKCGHEERTKVTGANVSVRLSDEFLKAVEQGTKYQLRWPVDKELTPEIEEWVDAKEIWELITQHARDSAEPGLLFWDNILRESPADCYADVGYQTLSTNPCGEVPLPKHDSCRLMVMNLSGFVLHPFTDRASFDWAKFHKVTVKAQRLMDDLVDLEIEQIDKILAKVVRDPESDDVKRVEKELWTKIREAASNGRRTGLGVTALGDTIAMLGVKYGSDEGIDLVERIYQALAIASYTSSVDMAAERGSFPVYDFRKEFGHPFLSRVFEAGGIDLRTKYEKYGRRNIANLTTAPTGSVSIMTQTTGGIEPVFKAKYIRRKKINPNDEGARVDYTDAQGDTWQEYTVSEAGYRRWKEVTGKTDADFLESPYAGAQAEEVDWPRRVQLQAAATRWLDHAVSSTVNLPKDVEVERVREIYTTAWKSGCKGITVYRDGSRDGVLVTEKAETQVFVQHDAPKRPEKLPCEVHRSSIKVGDKHEDWILFVGILEGKPYEIFGGTTENIELPKKVTSGHIVKRSFKSGGKYDFHYGDPDDPFKVKNIVEQFGNPERGWATRMISLSLRHGAPIQFLVEQLTRDKETSMWDFQKVVARVLKKFIVDGTTTSEKVCPDCGEEDSLRYQEGCLSCLSCGMSKCG